MSLLVQPVEGWPHPHELFRNLADQPGAFFLDSAWQAKESSAYSFIGFNPFLLLRSAAGETVVTEQRSGQTTVQREGALDVLRGLLKRFPAQSHPTIPFTGGAVGYFSYEMGASWERILPQENPTCPDCEFAFYDGVLAFAHATSQWFSVASSVAGISAETLTAEITALVGKALAAPRVNEEASSISRVEPRESKARYLESVARIKEFIRSGDIYQANLAQRFEGEWSGVAYELYEQLREQTSAPFGVYLQTSFGHLLSCSPESFLRLRNDVAETRPIKGTRPRGIDAVGDAHQVAELTSSAKERAELLMIVDLERNDLGRVCVPGSVKVKDLYAVETHPTVFHLVATVTGKLASRYDAFDLVRAMFPGGSITGAPKVRAMQIIRELETSARGPYTGSIGYFGFDGSADFNIAIRTVELRGQRASYHVGAGIVWDSDPESEYEETLAKGRALRAAIQGNKS